MKALKLLVFGCFYTLAAATIAAGDAACLDCHEGGAGDVSHAIYTTLHGDLNGGGAAACTACHGVSEAHNKRGRRRAPDVSFGPKWVAPVEDRNGACLACHDAKEQLFWNGSGHDQEGLACADCHTSHSQRDPALDEQQSQRQCLACHTQQQAELRLPSRHPIAEGKTACADCHNPHGSAGDAALHEVSVNDNCYGCHQEKRGPFLWEHEPVSEECSLCHRSHGSVQDDLLITRGPALCQQCHSAAFHPSLAYGGDSLSGAANRNVLGKNCLNCHSQIHGSNHPSGARLTR